MNEYVDLFVLLMLSEISWICIMVLKIFFQQKHFHCHFKYHLHSNGSYSNLHHQWNDTDVKENVGRSCPKHSHSNLDPGCWLAKPLSLYQRSLEKSWTIRETWGRPLSRKKCYQFKEQTHHIFFQNVRYIPIPV